MSRILLSLHSLSVSVPGKTICEDFSTQVHAGDRIALIGDNGAGKSTLLKALLEESEGGYLPQSLDPDGLSGGQRLMGALTEAMRNSPPLLLLDEPTNHLDERRRAHLLSLLERWKGAIIIATHDRDLLESWPNRIWSLEEGDVRDFHGDFEGYSQERAIEQQQAEAHFQGLRDKKKQLGRAIQKEETRKARTVKQGKKRWGVDKMKGNSEIERAQNTMGRSHKKRVGEEREKVIEELRVLRTPPPVAPRFHLSSHQRDFLIEVRDGAVGYDGEPVTESLNFSLAMGDRVALLGPNGSGKSTLLKALLDHPDITRSGHWEIPSLEIGYLDQHYAMLPDTTVEEAIHTLQPSWSSDEIAKHLGAFLFYHRAWLKKPTSVLSEGEKARLCLAMIAARTPQLLLLDEATNNLDMRTKAHLANVLRAYPGALLVTCHERAFLDQLALHRAIHTS